MTVIRRLVAVSAIYAAFLAVAPTPAEASGPGDGTYVVQPGDFLLGIAREHNVSLGSLLQANDLTATTVIMPGERLVIPGGAAAPGGAAPASTATASGLTYTVVAGDALSTIAARHRVSLSSLMQLNGLELTSIIFPGRQLEIPAGAIAPAATTAATPAPTTTASSLTYTVAAGDALSTIAARHRVSLSSVMQLNGLELTSIIIPGQRLKIPAGATPPPAGAASSPVSSAAAPAPSSSNSRIDTVVNYARAQVGKPYKFFTKGPATFDCSGLTLAAYARVGVSLIHFSAAQAVQGGAVDFGNEPIRAGDLIFQKRRGAESINHVGIAVSSTQWIQATGPGDAVRIGPIPATSTIDSVRRYIDA